MAFVWELRAAAAPIWEAEQAHPFVRGIGDGTIEIEKFKYYVAQDYVFLVEFVRVLGLAAAKAGDLSTMKRFTEMQHSTLVTEMALHRGYCERLGVTAAELEATQPSPTTYAYTRHLLSVAGGGTAAEIEAALLPCQWGYAEIGAALSQAGEPSDAPLYAEWIRTYASPEYQTLATDMCALLDRLAERAGPDERDLMRRHFLTSSRYEWMFWDAAYRMETWPV
jgi:thiaminase (transcriptional activator TenA)